MGGRFQVCRSRECGAEGNKILLLDKWVFSFAASETAKIIYAYTSEAFFLVSAFIIRTPFENL